MAEAVSPPQPILDLVRTLADGQWHSGEALARAEGLSRAALGKRIARARSDLGLAIEGEPGRGYRLGTPLDLYDIAALRDGVAGLLHAVHAYDVTDSTNSRLLDTDAAQDPQLCVADMQTGGRGRRGRTWHSPYAHNLYLSVAYSFGAFSPDLGGLPLALGATLADYLRGLGVAEVGVKWPNDVQVDGRKLAGLLVESRGEAGGRWRAVIGIGINVDMQTAALESPWTSLRQVLPHRPSRTRLAIDVARLTVATCQQLERAGFAAFRPRFAAFDVLAGHPVRVSGEPTMEGIARGIDGHGALLVETPAGLRPVHAGDVSVRPA